jgi:threonine aldolase
MSDLKPEQIRNACTRFLVHHYPQTPQQVLSDLAAATAPELQSDRYGAGEPIASFEDEVATLLGKPAAVFMPSGTMCQQIALRIWADRRGRRAVAFHPTCHLELHERQAYRLLHQLHGVVLGHPNQLMTLEDLRPVAEPLAALLIELPQREIGGQLPSWDELTSLCEWARERDIALHLDGARLWECQPFYDRSYASIAALFDSVYVSFYKSLGGIAGAILAGPADVIAEARVWQHRQGGKLVRLYPYVLSACQALAERLDRMAVYYRHACVVAAALAALPQVEVQPNPPQTNMFHLFLRGDRERLQRAALEVAAETGVWLFYPLRRAAVPGYQMTEYVAGDASLDIAPAEAATLIADVVRRAA